MTHSKKMETFRKKKEHQLAMGRPDKLEAFRKQGRLNARERLDRFFDPGTFREIGLFTHSSRFEVAEETHSDGKIVGHGLVDRRQVLCAANDLTVMGASSAATNMRKIEYVRSLSCEKGLPLVFLGESAGARIPDTMGSAGMAMGGQNPAPVPEAPRGALDLGPSWGPATAARRGTRPCPTYGSCLKGAVMAVSSPSHHPGGRGGRDPGRGAGGLARPCGDHRHGPPGGRDRGGMPGADPQCVGLPPLLRPVRAPASGPRTSPEGCPRSPGHRPRKKQPGLRHPPPDPVDLGRRRVPGAQGALRATLRHGALPPGRAIRGRDRQQPLLRRRRPQRGLLRQDHRFPGPLRLLQPARGDAGGHARLPGGQGRRAPEGGRQDHELDERPVPGHRPRGHGDRWKELRAGLPEHGSGKVLQRLCRMAHGPRSAS